MNRILLVANAIMTFPFGLLGLLVPEAVFQGFGLTLDPAGALIARGYAATLLAYGMVLFLMRAVSDAWVTKVLLSSAVVFNFVECAIQAAAGSKGITSSMIWGTVVVHGVLGALCLYAVTRRSN